MTDQNTIQHARHVLAKWRERATEGRWKVIDGTYSQEGLTYDGSQIEAEHEMVAMDHQDLDAGPVAPLGYSDARLIVGTAGNPDLLDAIDLQLRLAIRHPGEVYDESIMRLHEALAQPLAAAIIAADEQMSA